MGLFKKFWTAFLCAVHVMNLLVQVLFQIATIIIEKRNGNEFRSFFLFGYAA